MSEQSILDILTALDEVPEQKVQASYTPLEERIMAGFEDIQRFVDTNRRLPEHGETNGIFERLYAVRLERILSMPEARTLLAPLDRQGLLTSDVPTLPDPNDVEASDLLAQLGIDPHDEDDITHLRHVKSRAAVRAAADEIANRTRCADFDTFKPLFWQVQQELNAGLRETRPFELKAEIEQGRWFIVSGQKAYVAEKGEVFLNDKGHRDARLRVIFDNGTQSNLLMRSLQRALNRDEAGRRITEIDAGPLFSSTVDDSDTETGTIYVVRSKSTHPTILANRDLIHKIGVTGSLDKRFANAAHEASYLLADVELVANWELYNINRHKLEGLLHRFFAGARLDLEIIDRFGNPVRPREWFLVPLPVIDEVVKAIQAGTIEKVQYDPKSAELISREKR